MAIKNTISFLAVAGLLPLIRAEVPQVDGFTLTWSDDFVGTANSLPNTADWQAVTGTSYPGGAANWGTGEIETYTSSTENVALTGNGSLGITARKDAAGAWTSARLETVRTDFGCKQGGKMRIQGSISLPALGENGIGIWPAFWSLGGNFRGTFTNWPIVGELDVMENVNAKNEVFGTLHCGTAPGGPCNENTGLTGNMVPSGAPAQGNFHTYTLEVDRSDAAGEVLTWFLDGEQFWSVSKTDVNDENAWTSGIHNTYFLILNIAVGGAFPDGAYGSTTPLESTASAATMYVDYVAVYNSE